MAPASSSGDRRPDAVRTSEQRERRAQQGDQEGPQSSQGLDIEPGTPTDKASSQGLPDHGFHELPAQRATGAGERDEDEPVNTGGRAGADNTD
jgi:hypothetical protein